MCPMLREVVHQQAHGEAIVDGHPMIHSALHTNESTTEPGILSRVLRRGLFGEGTNGVAIVHKSSLRMPQWTSCF